MASRKGPEKSDAGPNAGKEPLAEAAEKASLVIRGLQSRLRNRPPDPEDSPEELERQLQQYFSTSVPATRTGLLNDVRERVIDGVAERILRHWEQNTVLENEVIERLIDRVLERLGTTAA